MDQPGRNCAAPAQGHGQRALLIALAALAALAVGGCAGPESGHRTVLRVTDPGFSSQGSVSVDALTDIGVPLTASVTNSTVRLRSVRLAGLPPAVHVIGVHAYSLSGGLGYGTITFERGSLPAECPQFFGHPRPVTAVTVRPKRFANWIITVVVRITKPGQYHFRRAKIAYTTHGVQGWQYQNLNLTIYSFPPPDWRLRIDPASSICGRTG